MWLHLVTILALTAAYAQLYPTLIQSRAVFLPSELPPHLQLAGAVPIYEPAINNPPPQVIGSSIPPRPVVVQAGAAQLAPPPQIGPPQLVSSIVPSQFVQTGVPQPMPLQAMPLQQQYPYPGYGYATQTKPDGPLKRFFKGAADGFVLGTMGWLG